MAREPGWASSAFTAAKRRCWLGPTAPLGDQQLYLSPAQGKHSLQPPRMNFPLQMTRELTCICNTGCYVRFIRFMLEQTRAWGGASCTSHGAGQAAGPAAARCGSEGFSSTSEYLGKLGAIPKDKTWYHANAWEGAGAALVSLSVALISYWAALVASAKTPMIII